MTSSDTIAAALSPEVKLGGRIAFVTGGTRGIGAAISQSLAHQGATSPLATLATGPGPRLSPKNSAPGTSMTASTLHQGNVASGDDCRRAVSEVIEQHGRLDILVNNAGITSDSTIAKMTDDSWNKVLSVNLSGVFYLSQAALAHMLERGTGRIINVSSVIGETGSSARPTTRRRSQVSSA